MSAVVVPLPNVWGASPEDWVHLDLALGLTDDLLPVVSNPHVTIAESSKLKSLGKVPSVYSRDRKVVGLKNWTLRCTTQAEIEGWMAERDYGICVQTRHCRAIDIDVPDAAKAARLALWWEKALGCSLPTRSREDSGKRLLALRVEGEIPKIRVLVDGGVIEFLGTGQQFIAVGTHPEGKRYRWEGGLPNDIPSVTMTAYRELIAEFAAAFATAPVAEGKLAGEDAARLDIDDPIADWLEERGLVLREDPRGLVVACPWADEHTSGEEGDGSTMWLTAGGKGKPEGHFKCMHAHCEGRTRSDYLAAVGYQEDVASQFEDLGPEEGGDLGKTEGQDDVPLAQLVEQQKLARFPILGIPDLITRPRPGWLIKTLLPAADLIVLYGESGSGKSFIVTDLALALARGVSWRGLHTRQARILYVVAEGSGGYALRLQAYAAHHRITLDGIPFGIITAVPNLTKAEDVAAVAASVKAWGGADLVVIDTFAQVTAGANENAGEDMGIALANARAIGRAAGGTVLLVHHSGKDAARGARGWSGIKAAADAELEVVRLDNGARVLRTTKQKDGRDDGSWGFTLADVWLGDDEEGDPVSSCVVIEAEVAPEATRKPARKAKRRGVWQTLVLETFAQLAVGAADGALPLAEVVLAAMDSEVGAKGTPKQRRFSINRALDELHRERVLVVNRKEGFVSEEIKEE